VSSTEPFDVRLAPAAARAFQKLEPAARSRIRRALEKLALGTPGPGRIAGKSVKTIRGIDDSFHRLRVGDYRVMYDVVVEDRVLLVLGIVHRGDLERWLRNR
jgi:mRNA-degrading endonuclease RelE of RelBE toxin-antitoxin system